MLQVSEWTSACQSLHPEKNVEVAKLNQVYAPLASCSERLDGEHRSAYVVGGLPDAECDAHAKLFGRAIVAGNALLCKQWTSAAAPGYLQAGRPCMPLTAKAPCT